MLCNDKSLFAVIESTATFGPFVDSRNLPLGILYRKCETTDTRMKRLNVGQRCANIALRTVCINDQIIAIGDRAVDKLELLLVEIKVLQPLSTSNTAFRQTVSEDDLKQATIDLGLSLSHALSQHILSLLLGSLNESRLSLSQIRISSASVRACWRYVSSKPAALSLPQRQTSGNI